jgi:hypothetical protein
MRKWRKMTWVLLIWCLLIVIWAIAGGSSASHDCGAQTYQNACNAGVGIGVALILVIGFVGFVFFSLIWLMSRPRTRSCPVCGNDVKRGATVCPSCDHDFAAAAGTAAVPAT